jgi:hypothetical protein
VNKWWNDNWDKVLTAVVSVLLSGVVGFFSAVISIRSEMSILGERVAKMEGQIASTLVPKIQTTEENAKNIVLLQQQLREIQKQTDISINTNKLLDLRLEQVRSETVQNLKALIDDARKQAVPRK